MELYLIRELNWEISMKSLLCYVLVSLILCGCGGSKYSTTWHGVVEGNSVIPTTCINSAAYYKLTAVPVFEGDYSSWNVVKRYAGNAPPTINCTSFGGVLDSSQYQHQEIIGGGPQLVLQYLPNPTAAVFSKLGGVVMSGDVKIPKTEVSAGEVVQLSYGAYFTNKKQSTSIAYVINIFDNREPELHTEGVQSDTYVNFVSTRFRADSKYATLMMNSSDSTYVPFSEYRHFSVAIMPEDLVAGISAINNKFNRNLSLVPEDYELSLVGVIAETTNVVSGIAYIQFEVKNFSVNKGELKWISN